MYPSQPNLNEMIVEAHKEWRRRNPELAKLEDDKTRELFEPIEKLLIDLDKSDYIPFMTLDSIGAIR